MHCPQCLTNTRVTSTNKIGSEKVQRYRECPQCHYGFITEEIPVSITATTLKNHAHNNMTVKCGQVTHDQGHTT
jgi:transcriptional regulator NrdR family protein